MATDTAIEAPGRHPPLPPPAKDSDGKAVLDGEKKKYDENKEAEKDDKDKDKDEKLAEKQHTDSPSDPESHDSAFGAEGGDRSADGSYTLAFSKQAFEAAAEAAAGITAARLARRKPWKMQHAIPGETSRVIPPSGVHVRRVPGMPMPDVSAKVANVSNAKLHHPPPQPPAPPPAPPLADPPADPPAPPVPPPHAIAPLTASVGPPRFVFPAPPVQPPPPADYSFADHLAESLPGAASPTAAAARRRNQYYEGVFSARDTDTSPATERVHSEAPVLAEVRTNVVVHDEFTIIAELSSHLAVRYRRPLSSIVVTLQQNACLCFGGSIEPAYVMVISALPGQLQPATNKRNAALLQRHMHEALGVSPARGLLRFVAVPDACLAYGGKTALGHADDLVRSNGGGSGGGSGGIMRRGSTAAAAAATAAAQEANIELPTSMLLGDGAIARGGKPAADVSSVGGSFGSTSVGSRTYKLARKLSVRVGGQRSAGKKYRDKHVVEAR